MSPGRGHRSRWHSDAAGGRCVGLRLDLSGAPFRGGVLQLKDPRSGRLLASAPSMAPGEAVLYGLSPRLRHRASPMRGKRPQTALDGWFLERRPRRRAPLPALDDRVRPAKGVTWRWAGPGLRLLHPRELASYDLDAVGARAWGLLARDGTLSRACRSLAGEYEAPPAAIARDLRRLVSRLLAEGLLEARR